MGWGLYRRTRSGGRQESRSRCAAAPCASATIGLQVGGAGSSATVKVGGRRVAMARSQVSGGRLELELAEAVRVPAGTALEVTLR